MSSKRLVVGQSMENHITEFLSIVDRLRDLGEIYNNLISSLEMCSEAGLSIDLEKEKLVQDKTRTK